METEQYLEAMLEEGRVRPLPGHLYAIKNTKNKLVSLPGYGDVAVSQQTASGLVVVSSDDKVAENYKALMVTVLVVGDNPDAWKSRWFLKKRDWNTTFQDQRIEEGTVLAVRAIAGVDQTKGSKFIQLRYDEVSTIGQPHDDLTVPDMLPAPGWVLVRLAEQKQPDGPSLVLYDGLHEVLDNGNMTYGRVEALPRGYTDDDLHVGDTICFPTHTGVGATEFIEFDNGFRCLPIDDVLGVQDV